ncbi:hypothetical protein LCGC14_1927320, partial [marine sediment metagenome]
MKLANFLKNRKITIIAYSPAILLIILFILTKFEIISDGFLPDLIQISAIIIALLVPSVSKEREATKEKKKLNKIYQESFNNLGELCMLCIERKQQITEYDVAIFQLSRKIKKYSDELLNLSITYNEGASNSIVSKSESIVIENIKRKGMYRRLSIRERACLQGFPITYQFYANSYSNKLKMIGNAIPPILTYYIASSMLEIQPEKIASPDKAAYSHPLPSEMPPVTLSKKTKSKYSWNRKF